jgi:hypothetical protein
MREQTNTLSYFESTDGRIMFLPLKYNRLVFKEYPGLYETIKDLAIGYSIYNLHKSELGRLLNICDALGVKLKNLYGE